MIIVYKGIELFVGWSRETSIPVDELPKCAGLYAEIHWASKGVRIGHTANIRARHKQSSRWAKEMQDGTAPVAQLRRNNVFCQAVKRGDEFGHCVISTDPRLNDKQLRLEVESFLFEWVARHEIFQDFNYQRGWKNTLPYATVDEAVAYADSVSH